MKIIRYLVIPLSIFLVTACKKLVSISDPIDRITSDQSFTTPDLAKAALNGVYYSLIPNNNYVLGYVSVYGGLSSDELAKNLLSGDAEYLISTNHLAITSNANGAGAPTDNIWNWAYGTIYSANAFIEGIHASTSASLTDSLRNQLIAEAKFVRAFSYFYLINFYGDVPLLLSTDYFAKANASRTAQAQVWQQIIQDLKDAQHGLTTDYTFNEGSRTRANTWAATALLARVYLYTKDYTNAAALATAVIGNAGLYILEPNLKNVFLTSSQEAIWQIDQQTTNNSLNSTPEGVRLLPLNGTLNTGTLAYHLSSQLLDAFEPGDARQQEWIDSSAFDLTGNGSSTTWYFCYKYTIGGFNQQPGVAPIEYSLPLRLAEQFLIRAEAEANGAPGGSAAAIADLNTVRSRASLPGLPANLSPAALTAAIAKEWQTEFFCEWAHRWFNLKRTGQAPTVLGAIPLKQPWAGDYQLVYPIPVADIKLDPALKQTPGY